MLAQVLSQDSPIFLDGAIGSEIERVAGHLNSVAWCGIASVTHPDSVRYVHEKYIEAGVNVVTVNTFASCRHVMEAVGYGDDTEKVNRRAVELAIEARDRQEPDQPVAIAGSLSNYVAWVPGTVGSDPAYAPSRERESANYREQAHTLAEAGCEVLITEMMTELDHSYRLIEAAKSTGLPVWIGLSASIGDEGEMMGWNQAIEEPPDRLPEGFKIDHTHKLTDLIDTLATLEPAAMGIMHSSFLAVTGGLEVLAKQWGGLTMAYPEAGAFNAQSQKYDYDVRPETFAKHCRQWVENGVDIVGGCCGTTIHHIQAMVDEFESN
ncbi:MAG: homocysteine S-methyltransferase family protein [Gammaproteobacteria bacterium]|nr:homocysteine S-methyltransferase family protein [Gammaproteobacteria bacterium]